MNGHLKCKIYGAATVGERGQVVIPAEIRKTFKVKAGDKLIVFARPGGMIGLVPTEEFNRFLNEATEVLAQFKK
ncbi:MAG: AbrB/MazE/SpoVT family DNA-binding domain-containing protein [Candidatus Omnitrophica bacterium]|nr:AbrB/MazE/SpoVT family DNA-binding domain-containing protein [Candidatus Omnitrophota bacterium]